jgi:hypothetical protein
MVEPFALLNRDHHHDHQPHTHAETTIVRNFVTPAPPPGPAPFIQGNSLDAANEVAARLLPRSPESFVTPRRWS